MVRGPLLPLGPCLASNLYSAGGKRGKCYHLSLARENIFTMQTLLSLIQAGDQTEPRSNVEDQPIFLRNLTTSAHPPFPPPYNLNIAQNKCSVYLALHSHQSMHSAATPWPKPCYYMWPGTLVNMGCVWWVCVCVCVCYFKTSGLKIVVYT